MLGDLKNWDFLKFWLMHAYKLSIHKTGNIILHYTSTSQGEASQEIKQAGPSPTSPRQVSRQDHYFTCLLG
jgi:hypothetical protein